MSGDDDFFNAMSGVKPMEPTDRVRLQKQRLHGSALKARREAAQNHRVKPEDPLAETEVKQLDPYAILEFRRSGVQHGVYKKLRLGRYVIDARLDLHRMTIEQARVAVFQFIRDCLRHDIRCALISHGKGEGRKKPAVLKSHIAHWLPQIDEILAFHSAQPQHGGLGCCYVMMKKSQKKRQENLERHQRRH